MTITVHIPEHFADRFAGIDHDGCLVIKESDATLTVLTPCCNAYAKGSDWGIICRSCYESVAFKYADHGTVAISREDLTVVIDQPAPPPTTP